MCIALDVLGFESPSSLASANLKVPVCTSNGLAIVSENGFAHEGFF